MGIADRHYYRDQPASGGRVRGGIAAISMWSVNTWLIVICVAVYVIDKMPTLPPRAVETGRALVQGNVTYDQKQIVIDRGAQVAEIDFSPSHRGLALPLLAYKGGPQIGWAEVMPMSPLTAWLHFSTGRVIYHLEWWRLIGFQFLHGSLMHLVFNMLGLYFFGAMVEHYLGSKRYLAFYLLCGIFGALTYLMLNLAGYILTDVVGMSVRIPGLLFNDVTTPLVGASAGVFGVIMAGAYLAPNARVYVFYVIPARLEMVAYFLVLTALFTVFTSGHNAGGEAAHLGGAAAGFYFIRHPRRLHGFFDFLGRVDPTSHHYRRNSAGRKAVPARSADVDRVLDKVHREGLHSLTDSEKRTLREASESQG